MKGFLDPVRLVSDFAVHCRDSVQVDHPDLPHVYDLELEVVDARLAISGFCVERRPGGEPVTIELLKSVPLVRLAATAGEAGILTGLVRMVPGGCDSVSRAEVDALPEAERVALFYRLAFFFGFPPTASVATELGVTHAVAAKRVQAARRAGLLEQTTKGRKGA